MLLQPARRSLVEAGRRLDAAGMVIGTSGNLSVRVDELIVVSPSGRSLATLVEDDLVVIDSDGTLVDGLLTPTSETPLHLAIYGATDAIAIAHVHALDSTALSCVQASRGTAQEEPVAGRHQTGTDTLPALHYTTVSLGGSVRVARYALYGTDELAANVVHAMRDGRVAALMANHGSIAYGDTIEQACDRLELLEWLCQLDARAHAIGAPTPLTAEQLQTVENKLQRTGYGQR